MSENQNNNIDPPADSNIPEEIFVGWVSGMCGKLVEYPFDTLKVRLQTGSYTGIFDCIKSVTIEEGIFAFYRGLITPLFGSGLEVSSLFFGFKVMENLLKQEGKRDLSMTSVILAGMGSGFGSAVILTPVELIKCRLQVKNDYKGPIDCIRRTFASEGIYGFTRGLSSTILREIPGNGAWFGAYHFVGRLFSGTDSVKDATPVQQLIAGGCAGMAYWGIPYPIDTIKSKIQTMPRGSTFSSVALLIFKQKGITGFYRGCGVTLLRAFPGNAVTFWVYERVMNIMHKK